MPPLRRLLFAALLLPVSSRLGASPPPPAPLPEALKAPVAGYDLHTPFQKWVLWIEAHKGAAAESALAVSEDVEGFRPLGPPLVRYTTHSYDFGPYMAGEIRAYCRPEGYRFVSGSCHYRLRHAFVPHQAGGYSADNPVSRWARKVFDAQRLTDHLRASGFGPDHDWWSVDSAQMFSVLPSPTSMLLQHVIIHRLDSVECPAMAEALQAVEQHRIDWQLDVPTVGTDTEIEPSVPHADWTEYAISTLTPAGAWATIQGRGRNIEALAGPVIEVAHRCERELRTEE